MRPFVSPQQIRIFDEQGFIAFNEVFDPQTILPVRGRHWFESEPLKRLVMGRTLPYLVAGLSRKPHLHLAWDRWIDSPLLQTYSLESLGSVRGLTAAVLLCVSARDLSPSPLRPGDALVIAPNTTLNWPHYTEEITGYLIAYAAPGARYFPLDADPLNPTWKKWGYGAGDLLKGPHNPLLRPLS